MKTQIIKGIDLSLQEARDVRQIWADAFGDGTIDESKITSFIHEDILFILRNDESKILSLGYLKSVIIKFLQKNYNISGIGGIVSVVQGKGYGKILMLEISKYLKRNNLMGIGFCTRKNTPFYEKCNFIVKRDLINRFVKKGVDGKYTYNPDQDDDVLYLNDKKDLMNRIIPHPKAKIYLPFWW